MMTINTNSMLDEECGQEFFDSVTDEELIIFGVGSEDVAFPLTKHGMWC